MKGEGVLIFILSVLIALIVMFLSYHTHQTGGETLINWTTILGR